MTRRGILLIASSVYDPLGFVAPFVLTAKVQEEDKMGRRDQWRRAETLEGMAWLSDVAVKRCYKPTTFSEVNQVQLHHFSDASQFGPCCSSSSS